MLIVPPGVHQERFLEEVLILPKYAPLGTPPDGGCMLSSQVNWIVNFMEEILAPVMLRASSKVKYNYPRLTM